MRRWLPRLPRFTSGALATTLAAFVAGCGGGAALPEASIPAGPTGLGTLQVKMHDCPVDEAESVFVTIERVEVIRLVDDEEVKDVLVDTPAQYDLLTLQNGLTAVLGTGQFPVGDYTSIRLIVAKDSKDDIKSLPADQLNNYIVIDGEAYPLVVPSGAQTGIKFNRDFSIEEGMVTTLTFDFDVRKSIRQRGSKKMVFHLRPTLRLKASSVPVPPGEDPPEEEGALVTGGVVTFNGASLPTGTRVSAMQGSVEVATTLVDTTTGLYQVGPLPEGFYDLVAQAPGYAYATEIGVGIGAEDSPNHDFVLTASDLGSITGVVSVTTVLRENVTVQLRWNGLVVATTGIDDDDGEYGFLGIPVGDYTVHATDGLFSVDGFATVAAGGIVTVDFTLP